jgi:hypothetical protein
MLKKTHEKMCKKDKKNFHLCTHVLIDNSQNMQTQVPNSRWMEKQDNGVCVCVCVCVCVW